MNAPVLRRPARMRLVLLEGLERQRRDYVATALGLTVFAVWERMGPGQVGYPAAFFAFLAAGVLPALPHERPPVWDAAMPVDRARHALVRLVCGVVWAAFILAVVTGLYTVFFADPEYPGWHPLTLFAMGLTGHLLVSAAFLSALHPAITLGLAVLVGVQLLGRSIVHPAELRQMGVWEVLARTALPVGLAASAAYAATRFPARAHAAPSAPPHPRTVAGLRPQRFPRLGALERAPAGALPIRRRGPGRRPGTWTVFRRHFALLVRVAIVPALTLLIFAWMLLNAVVSPPSQPGASKTVLYFVESLGLRWACVWIALSWTVLVWLREHGAQRRWNDTLPVGTGKRRVLHAAAGAVWLLCFVLVAVAAPVAAAAAAGTLASPADVPTWLWLGLPCRTLVLYAAATLVLFGTRLVFQAAPSVVPYLVPDRVLTVLPAHLREPFALLAMVFALATVPTIFFLLGTGHLENLATAMAGEDNPRLWSQKASALWLVPYAAAAAGAIFLNDWIHQRNRLPTVRELRRFFQGRAGETTPSGVAGSRLR